MINDINHFPQICRSEVDPSSLSNENKYHYPGIQNVYKKGNVEF